MDSPRRTRQEGASRMKTFLVQIKLFGYTSIEADSWEDAEKKAEDLPPSEFDMSKDCDIDVINEMDEDN